jgi:hypothetical protein
MKESDSFIGSGGIGGEYNSFGVESSSMNAKLSVLIM